MTPRTLFTRAATAEAVTWTLLILGMILKYVTRTTELGVRIFGGLHGLVFLAYVLITIVVAVDRRWRPGTALLALAASVPPWATVWFERRAQREGLLADHWRLSTPSRTTEGPEAPARTAPERLVATLLRHPLAAVLLGTLAVAALFLLALALGPPVPGGRG